MERALAEMRKRSLCHPSRAPDRLGFAVAIPDDRPEPRPVRWAHVDESSRLMAAHWLISAAIWETSVRVENTRCFGGFEEGPEIAPLEQSEGERDQVPHEGGLSTARRSLRRNWEKQHVAG